ncbi:MAG: hypothetical protein KDC12_04785 [Flavobacteriales bacterium]|nr:hypothetical protein [Flavobacteriales bacterium]
MLSRIALTCALTLATFHLDGQANWLCVNVEPLTNCDSIPMDTSLTLQRALQDLESVYHKEGYLTCSIDSIAGEHPTQVFLSPGPQFSWGQVRLLTEDGESRRLSTRGWVTEASIDRYLTDELSRYENSGYPFARVIPVSLSSEDSQLSITVTIENGPLVLFDSIAVKSDDLINTNYLQTHLGIKSGNPYDESLVRRIESRISEVPFLEETKPAEVQFREDGADLYIYVRRKRANTFNGLLGVQQNDNDDKITITGELDLNLQNILNQGEQLSLNWRRIQSATQQLEVSALYPYLLGSRLGIGGDLEMFRRDSTISTLELQGALYYRFHTHTYVKAFAKREATGSALTNSQLALANTRTILYGLSGRLERLDYRFNPRKGILADLTAAAGRKNFEERGTDDTNISSTTDQWEFGGEISGFIPLFQRFTFKLGAKGASKQSDRIYTNEMYRFGGMKTMRGMDESGLQVSSWLVATTELRFLLEKNSNVHLFFDQGWWESQSTRNFATDTPIGFGAGVSFETKSGIFALTYAMGRQYNNPVLLRNAKIHFGFTSFF